MQSPLHGSARRELTRRERWFLGVGGALALVLVATLLLPRSGGARLGAAKGASRTSDGSSDSATRTATPVAELTAADEPLTAYVAVLRAAGEPTTLREAFDRGAPVEGARAPWLEIRMAALVLHGQLQLENDFRDPEFWPWDGADTPEEETPENLARLAALAPRLDATCDAVAEALGGPRLRFPFEEEDSPAHIAEAAARYRPFTRALAQGELDAAMKTLQDDPPPAGRFRNLSARLTVAKALAGAAVASADPARRIASCRTLLLFGRKDEPTTLLELSSAEGFLVRGVAALRFGVERGNLDPRVARATLDPLLAGTVRDRLPAALAAERAYVVDLYRAAVVQEIEPSARPRTAAVAVASCEALRRVAALGAGGTGAWIGEVRQAATGGGAYAVGLPVVADGIVRCDAATRLARVALAVAEHRAVHGEFPRTLEELAPVFADGVPVDPYTDRPFVYSTTDANVGISSLGRLPDAKELSPETLRERCLVWTLRR